MYSVRVITNNLVIDTKVFTDLRSAYDYARTSVTERCYRKNNYVFLCPLKVDIYDLTDIKVETTHVDVPIFSL